MSEEGRRSWPSTGSIRASDEDRERAIGELNEHAGAGRLTTDELEERVQQVYAARTAGEIDAVRRDLPPTARQAKDDHAARRSQLIRRMIQETGGSASLFLVCVAVWLASGAHGQFWPVWVLVLVVVSVARNAWGLLGPAADLDAVEADLDARRERRLDHRQRHGEHLDRRVQRHAERRDRRLGR